MQVHGVCPDQRGDIQARQDNGTIQIANNTLNSKLDHVLELSITNSNGNQGFV